MKNTIPEYAFRWTTEYCPDVAVYLWFNTPVKVRLGRVYVCYALTDNGQVIFSGDDFGPTPSIDPLSADSALALLGFLTLQPGDTDEEYFEEYTEEQLDWIESSNAEELRLMCYDREEEQHENR